MPIKLFYNDMSPACRAVLMTAKALAIELELEKINIYTKEQIDENLIKLNPDHTIPTLVDNDIVIWNSYEIVSYLVEKYGKEENLYPKDSPEKDLVDEMLKFDSKTLFPRISTIISSVVVENDKEISTDKISAITEAYKLLDTSLEDKRYLAGDHLTIADFCCVSSVSTATIIIPISTEKYPNLSNWYRNLKNFEYYEETNGKGLNQLDALVELKLGRPRNEDICE